MAALVDVGALALPREPQVVVGVQVDVFVLEAPPEAFDRNVVPPTALCPSMLMLAPSYEPAP